MRRKYILHDIKICDYKLIMFNIIGLCVAKCLLFLFSTEKEEELALSHLEYIHERKHLPSHIRVAMIRHFAYLWFGKNTDDVHAYVSKLDFEDALYEAINLGYQGLQVRFVQDTETLPGRKIRDLK